MRALIVDDERNARLALRGMLEEAFAEEIEIIGEANSVPEAVRMINTYSPEVVFLDIEMPEYNGFDLLSFFKTGQIDFNIIFVTAYSEYALQAFEISASDYLLKPVRPEALQRAISRLRQMRNPNLVYQTLTDNMEKDIRQQKIVLQNAENIFVIRLSDIYYLEAAGSYTKFFINEQQEVLMSRKISDFAYLEKVPFFYRSHRSYLINLDKISRIDKKDFTILMQNGANIALAQDRKKAMLDKIALL